MATASERAYEQLRRSIIRRDHAPGSHLAEVTLAQHLQVSRTPVRDALRQLAADGLVEILPNRGARVVHWDSDDLEDIFSLRASLEGYAAGRAARFRRQHHLDRMTELVSAMGEIALAHGDADALSERTRLNNDFHREIVAAAGSARLPVVLGQLINVPLILQTYSIYSPRALARSQRQHEELLDAVRARNESWACSVMTAHILAAFEDIREADLGQAPERDVPGAAP